MDGRRFGQSICQPHLEHVPHTPFDDGPRDLAVESPGADHGPRCYLPIGLARLELDRDDLSAGVRLGLLIRLVVELSSRRGGLMAEGAVM
jgi:hypothetical protein